jgi:basic amino acid/polyamine antiporter, APA family
MGLWSKKSIALLQSEAGGSGDGHATLRRALGPMDLTLLGIGAVIGAGIFVLTGQAAAQYAGPAIVISFIIAGIGCLFAGLCYAEFASMIPIAGSAYTYAYATMGEFIAWIIGWDLILEYLFAASTVSVGWSGTLVAFLRDYFGIAIPARFASGPFDVQGTHTLVPTGAVLNVPAMVLIVLLTIILVLGIKESARFNAVIVFTKVLVVFLVIGFGFAAVNADNWKPFIPANRGEFGQYGWSGILRAAGVIFFAYIGFDAVSTAAQEAKNPQKDMPIGILGSLGICTVLYILMSLVITGLANYTTLNVPNPVYVALANAGPGLRWLNFLVSIGTLAGLGSVVLVMLMGQPRIFYSMSRDGLLPRSFSKVHPRFKTPYMTTILTGIVAMFIAGLLPLALLGQLVSIGTLFAFVLVCLGVLVLRYRSPNLPRPFRTPWVPFTPIMGVLISLALMAGLPIDTWVRLAIWLLIGLAIYFFYGRTHSRFANDRGATAPAVGD